MAQQLLLGYYLDACLGFFLQTPPLQAFVMPESRLNKGWLIMNSGTSECLYIGLITKPMTKVDQTSYVCVSASNAGTLDPPALHTADGSLKPPEVD